MPSSTPGGLRSFDSDVDGIFFPLTPFFLFLQSPDLISKRRPCSSRAARVCGLEDLLIGQEHQELVGAHRHTATGCKSLARGVRGYIHVHAIDASLQSLAQNLDLESGSVKRVLPLRLFDSTIHRPSERMSFLSDRVFSAWAFLVQSLYSRQKVYTRSEA